MSSYTQVNLIAKTMVFFLSPLSLPSLDITYPIMHCTGTFLKKLIQFSQLHYFSTCLVSFNSSEFPLSILSLFIEKYLAKRKLDFSVFIYTFPSLDKLLSTNSLSLVRQFRRQRTIEIKTMLFLPIIKSTRTLTW